MGFIGGIIKRFIKYIFYFILVAAFVVFIPNLPPYTKFTRIDHEPTQPFTGALAPNDILNNAEVLYKDKLLGPEAFQVWNGEVYTSLATGEIVKLSPGGHVTFVTKIGQPCKGVVEEHICGRPLGFVIDEKNKVMYVADAYLGIWKVNLVTDKKQLLVSPRAPIDGRVPKIFNSVALDKNGDLYWTDSSSDFQLKDGVFSSLVDPSGRLFHYNAAKNISKVLLDELWFANGVVISPDNQFVLVAETAKYRIIKYYMNGPKKGTSEVFVAGLPGFPDNLRPLPDGSGLLCALYTVFDDEYPLLPKTMSSAPLARKFIARVSRLIEIPFEFLQSQFPNHIFENIVYQIGHFATMGSLLPKKSGLVQIDWNGNIVASYYNTDGSIPHISDAIVYNNKLYTGNPHLQTFVGAVPAPLQLIKAFTPNKASVKEQPKVESKVPDVNKAKVEERKEVPKKVPVTQTTPPPTTTQTPTTKSNEIPKEKVAKPNAVPKDVKSESNKDSGKAKNDNVIKPKATAEVKNDVKPKTVPKEANEKPKVAPKDADAKTKTQAEAKPKVAQRDAEMKTDPQVKATQPKPTSKNQEKPVQKPESSEKAPKTNDIKKETSKKGPANSKTEQAGAKEQKSEPKNAKPKPTAADTAQTKSKAQADKKPVPEAIPIKEDIPSDTAKPKEETLKVIKKSGPQEIPRPAL